MQNIRRTYMNSIWMARARTHMNFAEFRLMPYDVHRCSVILGWTLTDRRRLPTGDWWLVVRIIMSRQATPDQETSSSTWRRLRRPGDAFIDQVIVQNIPNAHRSFVRFTNSKGTPSNCRRRWKTSPGRRKTSSGDKRHLVVDGKRAMIDERHLLVEGRRLRPFRIEEDRPGVVQNDLSTHRQLFGSHGSSASLHPHVQS